MFKLHNNRTTVTQKPSGPYHIFQTAGKKTISNVELMMLSKKKKDFS